MSFACSVMMMLLGSAVVMGFVLHSSKEEPAVSANQRCPDESLQSIRTSLLRALNMQTEPQLPAGMMDNIREQWQRTFSTVSQTAKEAAAASEHSAPSDGGNSTGLQCCSMTSKISLKELGWDSWVIHPLSMTTIQCAMCNPVDNNVTCLSSSSSCSVQHANSQDNSPCCGPISQEMVPIVYMDETGSVVISSVQLTRSCGCGPGNTEQQGKK